MIAEDIETGWEIFGQMPTSLKMKKIISVVGDEKWKVFVEDIPKEASEFAIVEKAIKKFEGEISEYFAIGNL